MKMRARGRGVVCDDPEIKRIFWRNCWELGEELRPFFPELSEFELRGLTMILLGATSGLVRGSGALEGMYVSVPAAAAAARLRKQCGWIPRRTDPWIAA